MFSRVFLEAAVVEAQSLSPGNKLVIADHSPAELSSLTFQPIGDGVVRVTSTFVGSSCTYKAYQTLEAWNPSQIATDSFVVKPPSTSPL